MIRLIESLKSAFKLAKFKSFFLMFRYLMVKFDFIRVKFAKTQNIQLSTLFTRRLFVDVVKNAVSRFEVILKLHRDFFTDLSPDKDFVNFTKKQENSNTVIDFINGSIFGNKDSSKAN